MASDRTSKGGWAVALAGGFLALGLVACDGTPSTEPQAAPKLPHAVMTPAPKALQLPGLTGTQGPLNWASFQGRWLWVYLGYANCPDVCPTALAGLAEEYRALKQPKQVQVVFVSVDPERDTPEKLKSYVHFYHPAFEGASGSRLAVDAVAKAFGASYLIDKPATATADFNYPVSHTNLAFIIDPQGRYVGAYLPESGGKGQLAADFNALAAQEPAASR